MDLASLAAQKLLVFMISLAFNKNLAMVGLSSSVLKERVAIIFLLFSALLQ